jgi:EAL domain-containing protein (putative c-di-GMP-specific phosphodiesterase class I)
LGVRVAIDDFGTGYSSLSYLKHFHVDALKIDRSFVKDMIDDPDDAQITATVVALARGLGIECVAEGVETEEQLARLRDIGCEVVQGYLVCRPVPLDGLLGWAHAHKLIDTGCYWSQTA